MITDAGTSDRELAVARAGCRLLDAEKANPESRIPNPDAEALKRWSAARIHDSAYGGWVIFRFPENVEPFQLVAVRRPQPRLPEAMVGPDRRLRLRDGFTLTDARMTAARSAQRDPLLRALSRARQGFLLEGAARQRRQGVGQRARHRAGRLPARREDFEMHALRRPAIRSARSRSSSSTTRCAPAPATGSATTA